MKHVYFSFLALFITLLSHSQDEVELFGEWYLHERIVNNITTIPPLMTEENYNIILDFGLLPPSAGNPFTIDSYGPITNTYEGRFEVENGIMKIFNITENINSCGHPSEVCDYFSNYNNEILLDPNTSTQPNEFLVNYEVFGTGDFAVLRITNESTGDYADYGRSPGVDSDLLGDWYLSEIEVDNVIHPNYYNDVSSFKLDIFNSIGSEGLSFQGQGACESFGGYSLNFDADEIVMEELNFTLGGGCPNPIPAEFYESLYFSVIEDGSAQPYSLNYSINGIDENAVLTIMNPLNGNSATYGRTQNPEVLTRMWYLSRIETPGNEPIIIPLSENPLLNLTYDINPLSFRMTASGDGECNSFISDYEVTLGNGNSIQLIDFSPTLADCSPSYEDAYFSIISNISTNYSEFEIINNGQTLELTDLLGARLIFNDDPLSTENAVLSANKIRLKTNPVDSQLLLDISEGLGNNLTYTIFSIQGKKLQTQKLNSETIDVSYLNSGLYFIQFYSESNQSQTLRFIKQ